MSIMLDFNNMMAQVVGAHGITQEQIDTFKPKIDAAIKAMDTKRDKMAWRDLPYNQKAVTEDILAYVKETAPGISALVVLGIGGSALGPIALQQALNSQYYNLHEKFRNGYPQLFVLDNIDPSTINNLFGMIDLKTTLFSVASKSGSTSETMSQFMIVKNMLENKFGKDHAQKHIVCTTDETDGNLINIAKKEGYKTFYVPSAVGGRFSQLCPVGLLPAAFCGIDIKELLAGAAHADQICQNTNYMQNPAYIFAILHYIALQNGKNITVMMPYADSLKFMADWFAQLWAESLGKKVDADGNVVNVGQTPVRALGTTDQHSQVQLYTEGPFDKIIVFLTTNEYSSDIAIPQTFTDIPSLGFLGGNSLAHLLQTQQSATEYALLQADRPSMTITLPGVTAHTMGQLFYIFEVATAFAGELLNINAFDQPGVEEGKNATYAMFDRPGYEDKKAELNNRPAKLGEYICRT